MLPYHAYCLASDAQIPSNKERLLAECRRRNISTYIDDPLEISSGVYSRLRSVTSEAELERRPNAKRTLSLARYSNIIAILAFLVSIAAFVKSFT
jgi:hypothetical protein